MTDAPLAGLSRTDLYLFNEGSLYHSYHTFGAHIMEAGGKKKGCVLHSGHLKHVLSG